MYQLQDDCFSKTMLISQCDVDPSIVLHALSLFFLKRSLVILRISLIPSILRSWGLASAVASCLTSQKPKASHSKLAWIASLKLLQTSSLDWFSFDRRMSLHRRRQRWTPRENFMALTWTFLTSVAGGLPIRKSRIRGLTGRTTKLNSPS